jgi:flagellar FliL protein
VAIPAHTPAQYLALDPPFVVNFEDQGLLRYLQVSLSVMTRDKSIIDAVTNNMPPIRDNLILLFGSQSFEILNSTEGKEKLRNQSLANIQAILREEIGTPGVEAIYFTNFVMQ